MDSMASFNIDRRSSVKKTIQKCGYVLCTFKTRRLDHMKFLWKTIIQPVQDYASQLWSPVDQAGEILKLEAPLKSFTKRIKGLTKLSYWDRLKKINMYSVQRRMERYKIIYTWKTINDHVPRCGINIASTNTRRGTLLEVPNYTGSIASVKTLRNCTLQKEGPLLFNSLPKHLRDLKCSPMTFKLNLDNFLSILPDQPCGQDAIPAATNIAGRPSNSIKDWIKKIAIEDQWIPIHSRKLFIPIIEQC